MSSENPYSAPNAALNAGDDVPYEPKVFSFSGRIGRLRYLAYGVGIYLISMLIIAPLSGGLAFTQGGETMSAAMLVLFGIVYIVMIVLSVGFAKRRLNDLDRSGWWFLLFIVPIVNIAMTIYVLFFPGTPGSNRFGPPPVENSLGVKILAWILPAIFLIGIAAAIFLPAYQQYASGIQ